jgi:hypothetical protein
MSFDIKKNTITVNGVEYDVADSRKGHADYESYTLELEGEPVFEGLEARVGYETDDISMFNPREDCNTGTISVSYPRYTLGDEDISEINFEIECDRCEGEGERHSDITTGEEGALREATVTCAKCGGNGEVTLDPAAYFRKERGARVVIGLFVYEHGVITISAGPTVGDDLQQSDVRSTNRFVGDSAGWDTSFVGFIYDTPEKVKEGWGDNVTDEKIEECLRQEIKTYADYLEGDVTWFAVDDEETNFSEGCGGYVGMSNYTKEECFGALEQALIKRINEEAERAYWLDRGVPTIA